MRSDIACDLSDSAYDFERVVWPAIKGKCGDGTLVAVESVTEKSLSQCLDTLAGIDGWHIQQANGRMRGLASRVQWGEPWYTFTIRSKRTTGAETELRKRIDAIRSGWLYPTLTVHAYVAEPRRRGAFLAAGICYTKDLYEFVGAHLGDGAWIRRHSRKNPTDGNEFLFVDWDELSNAKNRVGVVLSAE
jgi:hypothetical protein